MQRSSFIILALLLSSCITQKKCLERFPPQSSIDSIYIEKLKEVPVYMPGDTVNIEVPINCPDQDVVFMENSKLRTEIRILNGKLRSQLTIKPDTIRISVPEIHEKIVEVKVPEPVKYIPDIYRYALRICLLLLAAVSAYAGYRLYKRFG